MASSLPSALKSVDLGRFAMRAAQVEKAKPAVAYWTYYWIVQQIISRNLHSTDPACTAYTTELMDKVEKIKTEHAQDDSIIRDDVGQAVIEQFGLEIFRKADKAVQANMASKQTADTFLAAATFLDLLQIWPPVDPEIASKIKFAKYHALRIAKALKAGEDPNLSNPRPEANDRGEIQPLDPNDPEVQALGGLKSRQPTVEEASEEHDQDLIGVSPALNSNQSLQPLDISSPRQAPSMQLAENVPSSTSDSNNVVNSTVDGEVSPLDPPEAPPPGTDYFPPVPEGYSNAIHPDLPEAPPNEPGLPLPFEPPLAPKSQLPDEQAAPPSPATDLPPVSGLTSIIAGVPKSAAVVTSPPPHSPSQPTLLPPTSARSLTGPKSVPPPPFEAPVTFTPDEEAITKAQKHARWAISALNFEDVPTAISELRGALKTLGAE